ncbi:MAG: S8 family serine peptidase [Acidobacteriota bacterium]|nr:S8 family serine peptidase [Acidobacteriota bacterium]
MNSALSFFPDFHAAQGSLPNLRPHQPRDWSVRIVVSNGKDTHSDSSPLRDTDDLFVDFAVLNAGAASVTETFRMELFVNGRLARTFENERSSDSPLMSNYFVSWSDYWIGRLSAGTHTLKIVVDTEDSVAESNERDNEYSRTITVRQGSISGCFPVTTEVVPQGAGTITPSRTSTCTATTNRLSSLTLGEAAFTPPSDEPVVAVKPTASAQRVRALAALTAKAQAEGRVRVIVGLRAEGGSEASAASNFKDAEARADMVSRVDRAQQALLVRMSGYSLSSVKKFKYIPYLAMEVDAGALEALASDPEVVSIEEDKLLKPKLEESVPLVGAPRAWSQGFSGSGQTIAILDTGVDRDHRFLAGKVVSEACYSGSGDGDSLCPGGVSQSTRPGSGMPCSDPELPGCFHGTHVAGIAAGRGPDFSGVARDAKLISIQVFSKYGADDCREEEEEEEEEEESAEPCLRSSWTDQISGLERILELSDRFDVAAVNLSLGTVDTFPAVCDDFAPAYKAIVDKLRAVDIVAISSSGNEESSTGINSPACISNVVSAGSTDDGSPGRDGSETKRDEVSDFSNSSAELDLLAPGRWITSSYPENYFATALGTSLAAPHVAGAWAVLKSKAPNASVEEVLSALKSTGVSITDSRNNITRPRIQVDAAAGVLESQPRFTYTSGTSLTLTASPNSGFGFESWRGCDSVSGNRCTVRVSSARNVTALFESVAIQEPLQVPYQLTATPLGPNRIRLNWRDDNGVIASGFRIDRQDQGGSWELLVWLSRTRREFVDGSVEPERSYGYRMYAYDRDGEVSDWSRTASATTPPIPVDEGLIPLMSRRWVIPTTANVPGRFGGIFKTNLTLANLGEDDIEITARLYGSRGLVKEETISLKAVTYHSWNDFLDSLFEYRGAGAVEFTAEKPFQVASVEVFIETSSGRNTTVVLNQPTPPLIYTGSAISLGVNVNDDKRTNIGVFNSSSRSQTVTARVHSKERGADPVQVIRFRLPAKGYSQMSVSARVEDGFISWSIPREAYLYVVSVDNNSNDGTLTFPIPLE